MTHPLSQQAVGEAQAQREREIGAEQARQEQLFSQQRGIKSMEIEAEQAKESRKEEQNRRNNELELNTAIERNPEYKDSLENLRGYTGKGDVFKRFMDMALTDIRAGKLKTDEEIARAKAPVQIAGMEATTELKSEKAKTEAVAREKQLAEIDYLRTKAENEKGVRSAKTESDARKEFNKANNSKTGGELKSAATAFDALAKFDKDFVFGRAPEWLGELDFATAERAPALAPRARQLRTRMEAALAPIRKALFGASLTGTEKASFDLVSNTGQLLTTPVALIADAINTLRIAAARQTQDYYNSFLNDYPAMTTRNLSTSEVYKDVLKPEGVYGDLSFKLLIQSSKQKVKNG